MVILQAVTTDIPDFVATELTKLGAAGVALWYFYNRHNNLEEKIKSKDEEMNRLRDQKDDDLQALRDRLDEKIRECHEREVQLIQARKIKS